MPFSREQIETNPNIKLVDTDADTGIDLFCYTSCKKDDDDLVKNARGIVYHKNELILKGFPYTEELTKKNYTQVKELIEPIFEQCLFFDALEGSVIRMFHFSGKWYISTNRKLDAFKSKWSSSESFGLSFSKALENYSVKNPEFLDIMSEKDIISQFQDTLDTKKQYMFLLLNNKDNRIVCDASPEATVYHVGTFINGELSMKENIGLPYPNELKFNNIDEVFDYVEKIDYITKQGVIIFTPDNKQYKIFNTEYLNLYNVRGNEPSIKFRYLQLRMNKTSRELLKYLYPQFIPIFDQYENILYNKAKEINNAYINRFIKKNYVSVPVEDYIVISSIHSWHVSDRTNNKVSIEKVIEVLNEQTPSNLNRMIKKIIYGNKEK
jgi:hypothetical protein